MKHYYPLFFFLFFTISGFAQADWPSGPGDEAAEKVDIQIYPNPATSYIGLTDASNVGRVLVFNLVGRQLKMFEGVQSDERLYIGDLNKGIYLVQILDEGNNVITTRRVSKR